MSKEKLSRLIRYQTAVKERVQADVPVKHKNHPKEFKAFWEKELNAVTKQIEDLKMSGGK